LWTGPWRIEAFKSPLVVVIKHTVKRARQTVHVDRLILCRTPPPNAPDVDSGVLPDSETVTDGLTTPDEGTQPLPGWDQDSQSWGTLSPSPCLSPPLVRGDRSAHVADRLRWTPTFSNNSLGLRPLCVHIASFCLPYDDYAIVYYFYCITLYCGDTTSKRGGNGF